MPFALALLTRLVFLSIVFVFCSGFFGGLTSKYRSLSVPAENDLETILRVQIFLDNNNFGPGRVDGQLGQFTHQAVALYNSGYQHADGSAVNPRNWFYVIRDSKQHVPSLYATYTIGEGDRKKLNKDLPYEPEEQEKFSSMPYRWLRELIAERYHCDERFLQHLNTGRDFRKMRAGDRVLVPNVIPFEINKVPRNHQYPRSQPQSSTHVIVDTKINYATFYRNRQLIAGFPITAGREKNIPYGKWKVKIMVTTPTFRWDKKMLDEGVRSDTYYNLSAGPNNPVGIIWAGLNKSGIGLHGTRYPDNIGREYSAGCIRFANWDAAKLQQLIRPGASVEVR